MRITLHCYEPGDGYDVRVDGQPLGDATLVLATFWGWQLVRHGKTVLERRKLADIREWLRSDEGVAWLQSHVREESP